MPPPDIEPEVRQLLTADIETYDQVEVLLLLHANRDRFWSADGVAENLRLPTASALTALEHLCKGRVALAETESSSRLFKYAPADPAKDEIVAKLARAYADNRVPVIQLLSSNAIDRVRSNAIKLFADSFLLGRKKDDG